MQSKLYQYRLLIAGIMLTAFALYGLPGILIFKSDLTRITGKLNSADVYISTVTSTRGYKSQKSELIVLLSGYKRQFKLTENIGDDYLNEKYNLIAKKLRDSDSVSIWIKQSEIYEFNPEVFQIDGDKTILLDFKTIQTSKSFVPIFLSLLGIVCIILFIMFRYRDKSPY